MGGRKSPSLNGMEGGVEEKKKGEEGLREGKNVSLVL